MFNHVVSCCHQGQHTNLQDYYIVKICFTTKSGRETSDWDSQLYFKKRESNYEIKMFSQILVKD